MGAMTRFSMYGFIVAATGNRLASDDFGWRPAGAGPAVHISGARERGWIAEPGPGSGQGTTSQSRLAYQSDMSFVVFFLMA